MLPSGSRQQWDSPVYFSCEKVKNTLLPLGGVLWVLIV
jgi:hypothetical protein